MQMLNKITVYYVSGSKWDADKKCWCYLSDEEALAEAVKNLAKNIGGNRGKGPNAIYLRKSAAISHARQNLHIWPGTKVYQFEIGCDNATYVNIMEDAE